jgi:hypothetical protein
MPFSGKTVMAAFRRASGRCECDRDPCGHAGRCPALLKYEDQTKLAGAWRANYKIPVRSSGNDGLENCEILCPACYREAFGSVQL